MSSDQSMQQIAFQLASQQRTCPGDDLLFDKSPCPELEAHLSVCPACQERKNALTTSFSVNQDTFKVLRSTFSLPNFGEPAPGQIWKMKRRVAGWGPGKRYFNPPLLLVLDKESFHGEYKVAQTYSDDLLMSSDDVWLGEGIGFAQPWNIYTVNGRDLELPLAMVENEIFVSCSTQNLSHPRDIPSDSIIWYFRQMEKEVGEITSLRSSERRAMDVMQAWLNDAHKLGASLADRVKGWVWPNGEADIWGFLSAARPEFLPLTADEGESCHDIKVLQLESEMPPTISLQSCIISHGAVDTNGLLVRGFLPEAARRPLKLHACWSRPGLQMVIADEAEFDLETGAFKIRFHAQTEPIVDLAPLQLVVVTLA